MQLIGVRGQNTPDVLYDASGSITSGGTAQLIVPQVTTRTAWWFQNISDTNMVLEIGSATATATLTNGVVTSCTVVNGGFGFTIAPVIEFLGGGNDGWNMNNPTFLGCGQPSCPAPKDPAVAHCVLTGGSVSSIVVDYGGSNYKTAPYVFIGNSPNDPFGCAAPSATSGFIITPNGSFSSTGVVSTTDPIAVFCASTGKHFTFKFMA